MFCLLLGAVGLFQGAMVPGTNALIAASAPDGMQGSAFGLAASMQSLALLIGPLGGGFVSGLLANGGGSLLVPMFLMVLGLEMRQATGTSLVVIAANAGAGFVWNLVLHPQLAGRLDGPVLCAIAGIGMVGSLAGRRLARRFDAGALRRAFAAALDLLAAYVLRAALPRVLASLHALQPPSS